jgi:lysophospholipase L1-like esterase
MKLFRALALSLIACACACAQQQLYPTPPQRTAKPVSVAVDPGGNCTDPALVEFNYVDNTLWQCFITNPALSTTGVWTKISGSGSGGITAPGTTTSGYLAEWNSATGAALGVGVPTSTFDAAGAAAAAQAAAIAASANSIVTSGLIGKYAMRDASGTTLPDTSGNASNGTLIASPTIGALGITFDGATQYVTLPAGLSAWKTVQIFLDGGYANVSGGYDAIVGSDTSGKLSVLMNADSHGNHSSVTGFNGGFSTNSTLGTLGIGMVTYVADATADTVYINGAPNAYYPLRGGSLSSVGGSIELAAGGGSAGRFPFKGQMYYALFYNTELTAAQVQQNYAAVSLILANRGLVIPANNTSTSSNLVCDGDSITQQPGVGSVNSYCTLLSIGYTYANTINLGVSGYTLQSELYAAQYVDTILNPWAGRNTVVVFLGTNDIGNSTDPTVLEGYLAAYCQARKKAGWQVVVVTLLNRSSDANRLIFNSLVRAHWRTYADALADAGSNALLGCTGCSANTTYFQDGTHPTQAGQNILGTIVSAAINSIGSSQLATTSTGNSDTAGQITLASGTGSYTFANTHAGTPYCTASDTTSANAVKVAATATTLTLTGTTTDVLSYICVFASN